MRAPDHSFVRAAVGLAFPPLLLVAVGGVGLVAAPAPPAPTAVTFPKPLAADRYTALGARSPFSPPTAAVQAPVQPPPPPPPIWAEKFTLGSVAQVGNGYRVTLTPKNPTGGTNASPAERVSVVTGEGNNEDINIGNVQWSDLPGQTRVTLVKNGVPGVFTFENSSLSPGVTSPNAARNPGAINPSIPPAAVNPMNFPRPVNNPAPFQPPPPPPPNIPPGIVAPGNNRAPIRPAPPSPAANVPRVVLPPSQLPLAGQRPAVPGNNNGAAADDDDD